MKCYYVILLHLPAELEQELRNATQWAQTEADQDTIALLEMIRDVTHNKKDQKESGMSIMVQEQGQDLVELYKIFKA